MKQLTLEARGILSHAKEREIERRETERQRGERGEGERREKLDAQTVLINGRKEFDERVRGGKDA